MGNFPTWGVEYWVKSAGEVQTPWGAPAEIHFVSPGYELRVMTQCVDAAGHPHNTAMFVGAIEGLGEVPGEGGKWMAVRMLLGSVVFYRGCGDASAQPYHVYLCLGDRALE